MKGDLITGVKLLEEINNEKRLTQLIDQLNKDILLAGISFQLDQSLSPKNLVLDLNELVLGLIKSDFHSYMNLLYRIDLSEKKLKEIKHLDSTCIAESVTVLILKREWLKVGLRNKNR